MIVLDPDLRATYIAAPEPGRRLPAVRTLARHLALAQAAVRLKGQVSVLLTTDRAIRKLNRQFRGKDKPTDVLSFPAAQILAGEVAGDLAISVPTALRQAKEQGHSLAIEVRVLMLHGLLHLAGYDHEADHGQMARRERLLRAKLRLPQGLIERVTERRSSPALSSHRIAKRTSKPAAAEKRQARPAKRSVGA